ncbi:hypothetical protein PMAYCL1PPCAC_20154 [Pristionchus mayeri]|uniref:Uncharacterized protein n=1 Tax=Pristionchus mayeri TaxID=1317129 RepID=A0AAN5CTB4_9BILA|nr:hypothetical protein PMAYCL1PPCAC_20154 [Pristionchus mayeri]
MILRSLIKPAMCVLSSSTSVFTPQKLFSQPFLPSSRQCFTGSSKKAENVKLNSRISNTRKHLNFEKQFLILFFLQKIRWKEFLRSPIVSMQRSYWRL